MSHFIFIQQISILNILKMLYNLHFFFSSKCHLFYNATLFGFHITHILNTECAKIWKKKSVSKRLRLESNNSLGWVTNLPLDSPVVVFPHFSLWPGMVCSISSANDGTVIPPLWLSLQSFVSRGSLHHGQGGWGLCRRGYWMHFTAPCNFLIIYVCVASDSGSGNLQWKLDHATA